VGENRVAKCAFFDESGHPKDPNLRVFAVGGFVTSQDRATALQAEWRSELAREGVSWFHATELEQGIREYSGWSAARREEFRDRMIDIIRRNAEELIGSVQHLVDPSDHGELRSVYYKSYRSCAHDVVLCCESDTVDLVFARQEEVVESDFRADHQALVAALKQHLEVDSNLGGIDIRGAREVPALQAADLVVYELARHAAYPKIIRPVFEKLGQIPSRFRS